MNPRVTLGLLAVLVALGGYVYFAGPSGGETSPSAAKEKPVDPQLDVLKFDDRETQRLVVRRGEQQTTVEKDADGTWRLQPSGEPADRMRLNGVLLRLSSLRATRRFEEPASLADFGLAVPQMGLTVRQGDGTELGLLLGGKAPAEAGTYAKRTDEAAVFVISNALVQDLERLLTEPPREPTPTPVPTATPAP